MNNLPLADLEAFAAVAESRNFRRAAALRGVSASALSEAVRRLEARLDSRLLNRTTRSVTPTEAGQRLLDRIVPMLGEISGALDQAKGSDESPAGRLRLNVPTFVARAILPRIAIPFLAAYPGITLEAEAKDSFIDVFAQGFDAGIRYDESLEQDMIAVPIGPRVQRFATAASPAYLAARGMPQHPRDLLGHACIRHKFDSGRIITWEFERDGEVIRVTPSGQLIANTLETEIKATLGGLGLISTFHEALQPYFDSGQLMEVLQDWQQPFSGPFLYYPSRRHMPAPLRAFVDFVKDAKWSEK
jgi:DNA-binding transcriptional LysR family regulator